MRIKCFVVFVNVLALATLSSATPGDEINSKFLASVVQRSETSLACLADAAANFPNYSILPSALTKSDLRQVATALDKAEKCQLIAEPIRKPTEALNGLCLGALCHANSTGNILNDVIYTYMVSIFLKLYYIMYIKSSRGHSLL